VYSGTGITINSIRNAEAQADPGGVTVETLTNGSGIYDGYYGMKYTFEKLNYELFEFSNKTINLMMVDNFITNDFDVDITVTDAYEFNTQVNAITFADTYIDSLYKLNETDRPPIKYYLYYTGVTTPITSKLTNINDFVKYTIPVERHLEDGSTTTDTIYMSGLLDMIFLDFIDRIADADKATIMTQIKAPENKPRNIGANPTTNQLNDRYNKISNTLDRIFTRIKEYKNSADTILTDIADTYTANYDVVKTS
jgi:hypothetical protein